MTVNNANVWNRRLKAAGLGVVKPIKVNPPKRKKKRPR